MSLRFVCQPDIQAPLAEERSLTAERLAPLAVAEEVSAVLMTGSHFNAQAVLAYSEKHWKNTQSRLS